MAAQAPRLVKVERMPHRDGVNRLRKAYHRLWQFSVQRAQGEAAKRVQVSGCVQAHRTVREGQP